MREMPSSLTLGLSPCPNDTFIFHALLHGLVPGPCRFVPHMADVEELNGLALRGRNCRSPRYPRACCP